MISSKQVLVSGGQFSQYNYNGQISLANRAPIDILTDTVAPSAFHDSGASFDKPKCHPRTRLKVLEIIMRWIVGEDEDDAQGGKLFMWLNGAAGCGKSSIAQSTIESCIERGLPLASFFFSRSDSTRNHIGSLVATLAYQLYCAFPGTQVQTEIISAIHKDPLIFRKTLQQQFTALIIQPLKTCLSSQQPTQHRLPFLIVIDGLDECIDRAVQKAVLNVLADAVRTSDLSIQIFVTSRPEHEIRLSFNSKNLKDVHTALSLDLGNQDDADSDIRLYLFDRFAQIKDDFNDRTTGRKLAEDWPGDGVIETLVWKSSGQFIYAATVIRYVESTRHRPDHRLDIVLKLRPVTADHPFAELDALYEMILQPVLDVEKVLHVLSLYLMGASICCSTIEKLLSYDEGEVETLFCDTGALVQISKSENHFPRQDRVYDPEHSPSLLRILHASFEEYLLDPARSKQFHIDMDYHGIRHVTHVLQYLASCCSSSFNPSSITGSPIHVLVSHQYDKSRHIGHFSVSLELQQSVLSFPLKEFLEPHTSTRQYPQLLECFVSPFLKLLEAIVLNDPTSSYIQDHQLGILHSSLLQQIHQYFNGDRQAAVLVLFYHLGSHRFVPILQPLYIYPWRSTPFYLDDWDWDPLSLSLIWNDSSLLLGGNIYHRYVRQLLRDPGRTTEYALGPAMHAKATLFCFKELAKHVPFLLSPSAKSESDIATDTDDANPRLSFNARNESKWYFEYSPESKLNNKELYSLLLGPKIDEKELYFLLLGYAIFLLPRCGRSEALVTVCEEHRTSYVDQPDGLFPIRRRLLYKEIDNYLVRVSTSPYV